MKRTIITLLLGFLFFLLPLPVSASDYNLYDFPITPPIPCNQNTTNPIINCPNEMLPIYQRLGKACAVSYSDFLTDPINKHYWVEDDDITAQGKANERARQFLYWVISTEVISDAPVLNGIWNVSSLIALFGVVLIAAIFGIGYIISQRTQYNFNIRIWPTIIKIAMMLLFISFSSAIVFVLIQFSELLMKFFYDNLGGNELFNIYFADVTDPLQVGRSEQNYLGFVGCRDMNIRVKDGIDTEMTMLKLTNVTYYVMGTMLLLRQILLWFLLFVSPFLALLMPFVFIRNTGWIWIGVFFQWLFYGPLFTLFLGALARIWKEGIPWNFDFSRTSISSRFIPEGYVYPTGINIVYGGPAQRITSTLSRPIDAANNGSYIDTYAEYILTLIMLWAVTFFPWWLLRIFRDYCCDGIFAMKNILLAMYNQQQQNSTPPPNPNMPKGPTLPKLNLDLKTPVGSGIKVPIGTIANFSTLRTGDIARNMNLQATKIIDVAKAETNKQMKQSVNQNISYLSNPVKATTPAERQQYMKLRAELFNRAIKNDTVARTMLASTSTSQIERSRAFQEILTTMPQTVKVTVQQIASAETKQPVEKVQNITNTYTTNITNNNSVVKNIANTTKTSQEAVKNILQSYSKQTDQPISNVIKNIAQETNTTESTVKSVLSQSGAIGVQAKIIAQTSQIQKLSSEQTTKILDSIRNTISNTQNVFEKIAGDTKISQSNVKSYISNVYNETTKNEQNIQQIANQSGATQEQVRTILTSYSSKVTNTNEAPQTIINQIANESNTSASTVQNVMNATNNTVANSETIQQAANTQHISKDQAQTIVKSYTASSTQNARTINSTSDNSVTEQTSDTSGPAAEATVSQVIAQTANTSESVSKEVVKNIMSTVVKDETLLSNVQQQTGLQKEQISNIINTYTQNIDQPASTIIEKISQASGVKKEEVRTTLENISSSMVASTGVVEDIAEKEGMKTEEVANVIQSQMQVATAPEQNIEKTIQIPDSVSLEDYEEVKQMWMNHYEEGDVPVSENIQNRAEWVEHETVFITNTLNKLLSTDEKLRQQGLDELGYLLPIFLINNLKGEELIVYLKAKLEAAKTTGLIIQRENKVREKMSKEQDQDEEMFVDIKMNKTEEKHLEMDLEDEKKLNSIEDRVNAVQSKLAGVESNVSDIESDAFSVGSSLSEISSSLKSVKNTITRIVDIARSETSKELQKKETTPMTAEDRSRILTSIPPRTVVTLEQITARETKQSEQKVKKITTGYTSSITNNNAVLQTIASTTNNSTDTVKNIIQNYALNVDQPVVSIIDRISETTGTPADNIRTTLSQITNTIPTESIAEVAKTAEVTEDDVANVIESQMQIATAPEENVEKTIQIPESVSLEDYEEVKEMWMNHYEKSEVPMSDTITDRLDWIEQEIVFITNTLNKLLSTDETLRQEGIEELGYLLPIFLVNNLKGEELIVYLKAKLEAAKAIRDILKRETKLRDEISEDNKEKVFVDTTPTEPEKQMTVEEEEDKTKSVQDKLSALKDEKTEINVLDGIKQKLEEQSDKEKAS